MGKNKLKKSLKKIESKINSIYNSIPIPDVKLEEAKIYTKSNNKFEIEIFTEIMDNYLSLFCESYDLNVISVFCNQTQGKIDSFNITLTNNSATMTKNANEYFNIIIYSYGKCSITYEGDVYINESFYSSKKLFKKYKDRLLKIAEETQRKRFQKVLEKAIEISNMSRESVFKDLLDN
jgi:hypothetical protein